MVVACSPEKLSLDARGQVPTDSICDRYASAVTRICLDLAYLVYHDLDSSWESSLRIFQVSPSRTKTHKKWPSTCLM
jgi:hypothetical protein